MSTNKPHDRDRICLENVLENRTDHDPTALVLGDVPIIWDVPGLRPHSPDISVIFDVHTPPRPWSSFNEAEEGTRPTLLVEIVSPNSRVNDVDTKVEHYERAGVPWYVIVDREQPEGPVNLIGYRLGVGSFERMTPDAQGRLCLEPWRLWLGVRDNRVVCYDPDTGEEIGDYEEVCRRKELAEAKAMEEERARQAAEARLRELEDQLRRLQRPPS